MTAPPATWDAVVVGAGIAGLMAASTIAASGRRVIVLDKSRGVGGRMATRRVGGAVCDHGAQFFTARTEAFQHVIDTAAREGMVVEWCRGFARDGSIGMAAATSGDGHPRYRGARGMSDLPKWLVSRNEAITVRTAARATAVAIGAGAVRVTVEDEHGAGDVVEAAGCVLTPPVPQSLDLLAAGAVLGRMGADRVARLQTVAYDPCFAVMLVLARPSLVPEPGAIQFADDSSGPVAWVADNRRKGLSAVPALTVHATGSFSREHFDAPLSEVATSLSQAIRPWIDGDPQEVIVERSIHRWKYATPTTVLPDPVGVVMERPPIACCGDAFAGPRVEGAFASGAATGAWMVQQLQGGHR